MDFPILRLQDKGKEIKSIHKSHLKGSKNKNKNKKSK